MSFPQPGWWTEARRSLPLPEPWTSSIEDGPLLNIFNLICAHPKRSPSADTLSRLSAAVDDTIVRLTDLSRRIRVVSDSRHALIITLEALRCQAQNDAMENHDQSASTVLAQRRYISAAQEVDHLWKESDDRRADARLAEDRAVRAVDRMDGFLGFFRFWDEGPADLAIRNFETANRQAASATERLDQAISRHRLQGHMLNEAVRHSARCAVAMGNAWSCHRNARALLRTLSTEMSVLGAYSDTVVRMRSLCLSLLPRRTRLATTRMQELPEGILWDIMEMAASCSSNGFLGAMVDMLPTLIGTSRTSRDMKTVARAENIIETVRLRQADVNDLPTETAPSQSPLLRQLIMLEDIAGDMLRTTDDLEEFDLHPSLYDGIWVNRFREQASSADGPLAQDGIWCWTERATVHVNSVNSVLNHMFMLCRELAADNS